MLGEEGGRRDVQSGDEMERGDWRPAERCVIRKRIQGCSFEITTWRNVYECYGAEGRIKTNSPLL